MPRKPIASIMFLLATGAAGAQAHDSAHSHHRQPGSPRQAEVAQRGQEVMPFSLAATTHIFSKTAQGGVQQVVVKDPTNAEQLRLTRLHLQDIRTQFLNRDFSGPTRIHGHDMPGLSDLQAASPGQIAIHYRDLPQGAELGFTTAHPGLVAALHRWFDAQLADHGSDAVAGPGAPTRHGAPGEARKP